MGKIQRKQGMGGLFTPVSWNKGRRFTSPGPELQTVNQHLGIKYYEGPLLKMQIEAYLDDNPEFTASYFSRKMSRKAIEDWLQQHSTAEVRPVPPTIRVSEPSPVRTGKGEEETFTSKIRKRFSDSQTQDRATLPRTKSVTTPARKISASLFEASGLKSAILSTTEDGSASFLTSNEALHQSNRNVVAAHDQTNNLSCLEKTGVCMTEMTDSIMADLDVSSLCHRISEIILQFAEGAEACTIAVPLDGLKRQHRIETINIKGRNYEQKEIIPVLRTLDLDNSIISSLSDGDLVSLPLHDDRIEKLRLTAVPGGYILLPFRDVNKELQGFAAVAGICKSDLLDNTNLSDFSRICGVALSNATRYNAARLEVTRSQVFLDLAKVIFDEESSIEFTVLKILVNLIDLIECERAQVMLSSRDSTTHFQNVFDLQESDLLEEGFQERRAPYENRFPIISSIAGIVAATGETVCIDDVNKDPRFDLHLNGDSAMIYRSLMCMPILDSDKKVLGVVLLINKKGAHFSRNDEQFVEAFGVFCGIALRNVSQFETAKEAEARAQIAMEIMSYHADSDVNEAQELAKLTVPSTLSLNIHRLSFDNQLKEMDTLRACLRMFYELQLVSRFNLDHGVLCRWLLTVKKNYRSEVLYHNWDHAFSVAQMMFASLLKSRWWEGLGAISCIGLIIACLCHDIDHRGTNNKYQVATDSPLARLYSTSTLEKHHLDQCLLILNLDGNKILDNMSAKEYRETMIVIKEAILATDLSLHFKHRQDLENLAQKGPKGVVWHSPEVLKIIRSALMTASDLGASTKPWRVQVKVAELIAEEFWQQGDLEKEIFNAPSDPQMDRAESKMFPKAQVKFCEGICMPVYKHLANLSPELAPLHDGVKANRDKWLQKWLGEEVEDDVEQQHGDEEEESNSSEGEHDNDKVGGTKIIRNL